jgi:cell division protein FtsW (lipid II flippase)
MIVLVSFLHYPAKERTMRDRSQDQPNGLSTIISILCISNLMAYLLIAPGILLELQVAVTTVLVIVAFVVIWFFWKGSNWARIIIMASSVLYFLNGIRLLFMHNYTLVQQFVLIFWATFSIYLLFWLKKDEVVLYFRKHQKDI